MSGCFLPYHGIIGASGNEGVAGDFVRIGGNDYPIVKIGNLWWMAENLHEPLGTFGNDRKSDSAWSSGNETYAREHNLGMIYRTTAFWIKGGNEQFTSGFLSILPEGWRIPYKEDFDTLESAVGGSTLYGKVCDWIGSLDGSNTTGLSLQGSGNQSDSSFSGYSGVNAYAILWTSNVDFWNASDHHNYYPYYESFYIENIAQRSKDDGKVVYNKGVDPTGTPYKAALRLVKDAT